MNSVKCLLKSAIGEEHVSSTQSMCINHSTDEGIERKLYADVVVWPGSVEEVSAVARICCEKKIPMIPFGTGTGLESGVCAPQVVIQFIVNVYS